MGLLRKSHPIVQPSSDPPAEFSAARCAASKMKIFVLSTKHMLIKTKKFLHDSFFLIWLIPTSIASYATYSCSFTGLPALLLVLFNFPGMLFGVLLSGNIHAGGFGDLRDPIIWTFFSSLFWSGFTLLFRRCIHGKPAKDR
jgi:hypothetical protein